MIEPDSIGVALEAELYFIHSDHLGTPKVMTGPGQAVVWKASHTPFGQATVQVEEITKDLRFPGQYFDVETGLHYNWNRYYDSGTGRYISSDPVGLLGGLNTYLYVDGNPIRFIGFLGLMKGIPTCFKQRLHGNDEFKTYTEVLFSSLFQYSYIEFSPTGVGVGLGPDFSNNSQPSLRPGPAVNFDVYEVAYDFGRRDTFSITDLIKHLKVFCEYKWKDECGREQTETTVKDDYEREEISRNLISSEYVTKFIERTLMGSLSLP